MTNSNWHIEESIMGVPPYIYYSPSLSLQTFQGAELYLRDCYVWAWVLENGSDVTVLHLQNDPGHYIICCNRTDEDEPDTGLFQDGAEEIIALMTGVRGSDGLYHGYFSHIQELASQFKQKLCSTYPRSAPIVNNYCLKVVPEHSLVQLLPKNMVFDPPSSPLPPNPPPNSSDSNSSSNPNPNQHDPPF